MDLLNNKIAEINSKYPAHERLLRTKSYVQMMCDFPNLNKLCRLHCSTEMVNGQIATPHNMIGFDGCYANVPDRRCFENDVVAEEQVRPIDSTTIEPAVDIGKGQSDSGGREKASSVHIFKRPEHHDGHVREAVKCDSESIPEQLEVGVGTSSSTATNSSMIKESKGDSTDMLSKVPSNEYSDGKQLIGKRCKYGSMDRCRMNKLSICFPHAASIFLF